MTVCRLDLARLQRHFEHRGLRLLAVQLLHDVLLGEQLDLNPAFAVLGQDHPAGADTDTSRQQNQCPNHGRSSIKFLRFTMCNAVRRREQSTYQIRPSSVQASLLAFTGRSGWTTNSIK